MKGVLAVFQPASKEVEEVTEARFSEVLSMVEAVSNGKPYLCGGEVWCRQSAGIWPLGTRRINVAVRFVYCKVSRGNNGGCICSCF